MLKGSCHCGEVKWTIKKTPDSATACNCSVCRRYGVLWAYDFENEGISVNGSAQKYKRAQSKGFYFCPTCGCVAYWRSEKPDEDGRRRIAVNIRLAEDPEAVLMLPIDHFDGLVSFQDLPRDGKCVSDYWF